ncbi:MAG: WXG100 family type VII secretion target [Gemmataceae bacterium]
MAQAVVDPGELRRFAQHLKQFNQELRDRIAALHGHVLALSDTWRDQEHEKFAHDFEQTMRVVQAFLAQSDLYVPFLQRKAERVETYLGQR